MPDFIIIGGGVYGCAVAWELAARGAEVTLLEATEIAAGASGGPGRRGVRANERDRRELPLMRLAYERWPLLSEQLDSPIGYERTGHLLLIERPRDLSRAEALIWQQTRQGIPSRLISGDELRQLEPYLSERILAAVFCPNDGVADHSATTRAFARAAGNLGAQIRTHTRVVGLERQREQVMAVFTAQEERIPVGRSVLLLNNSHVQPFVQAQLGLTLPLWEALPQVILTDPVDPLPLRHLIGHAHRTLAMKAVPGQRIMISGGWRGRRDPQTGRPQTVPEQVSGNFAEAVAVYPTLAESSPVEAAADRPELIAVDQIPIIDCLPGADNMIVAAGWSGHGWAIAPAVATLLADWALTGRKSELLQSFSYHRFDYVK